MADEIELLTEMPGYPTGTRLVMDRSGAYRAADGVLWLSEQHVIADEAKVRAPLANPDPIAIKRIVKDGVRL